MDKTPHNRFAQKIRRTDQTADIRAKHQAKANNPKNDTAQTQVHKIFHHDIAGIFSSGKTGLDHSKARLHKKYHKRSDQYPHRIRCCVFFHHHNPPTYNHFSSIYKKEAYPQRIRFFALSASPGRPLIVDAVKQLAVGRIRQIVFTDQLFGSISIAAQELHFF